MFLGSTIIEVAIGVVFVYVLLSLICSAINEWIAGIFRLRASFLRRGITNLLDDPIMGNLSDEFFEHPLIKAMSQTGWKRFYTPARTPSYLSASTFARVLIDLLPSDPATSNSDPRSLIDIYQAARKKLAELKEQKSPLAHTLLLLLDKAGIDEARIAKVNETSKALDQVRKRLTEVLQTAEVSGGQNEVKALLETIKNLESYAKQLDTELTHDLLQVQHQIELYFDETMERVSGWYKRYVQVVIAIIAFVVSLLLNADSIAIVNALMLNSTLRSTVVAAAQNSMSDLDAAINLVNGTTISNTASITDTTQLSTTVNTDIDALQTLKGLGLPLGWNEESLPKKDWFLWFPLKLIGLLITTAAAAMGAPFWFDLLTNLVNLRMAGKKPDETPPATPPLYSANKQNS